ncbi:MAG TPA: acyltransferase [Oxalicibacterium sp.]|nr:acyltransferase [Oxalicibacterium sp.]
MSKRMAELDGLRGLAILLVVMFHFYVRWPEIYPYRGDYAEFFLFKYGFLGVQLFFMISGFVIFMSLDASKGVFSFVRKRWIRLFPAMLTVSIFLLISAPLFIERPFGEPELIDLLPGLLFIEGSFLRHLFALDVHDLEGAFWSLYVEVRFYLMVSVMYFTAGRKRAVLGLFAIAFVLTLMKLLAVGAGIKSELLQTAMFVMGHILVGHWLYWFLIGIVSYFVYKGELQRWAYPCVLLLLGLALLPMYKDPLKILAAAGVAAIFIAVTWHGKLQGLFRWPLFAFFGMISYPLYLIHENAGVALIIKGGKLDLLPHLALPVVALAIMVVPAYLVAVHIEPRLQNYLRQKTTRMPDISAPAV